MGEQRTSCNRSFCPINSVEPQPSAPAPAVTRWTLVVRSRGQSPEAREALAELCEAYYQVVEDFIRRQVAEPQTARDLTHAFFARVLAGSGLGAAEPARGRFRSYLFGAVKNFLSVERARQGAAKRGGGVEHLSLDQPEAKTEAGVEIADTGVETPEAHFDRQWATAMLARSLERLGKEMAVQGKGRQFDVLKVSLQGAGESLSLTNQAATLGMSEAAVKVAVHRLRRRFREAVRQEIGETLHNPALIDEEMRHLVLALRERP